MKKLPRAELLSVATAVAASATSTIAANRKGAAADNLPPEEAAQIAANAVLVATQCWWQRVYYFSLMQR